MTSLDPTILIRFLWLTAGFFKLTIDFTKLSAICSVSLPVSLTRCLPNSSPNHPAKGPGLAKCPTPRRDYLRPLESTLKWHKFGKQRFTKSIRYKATQIIRALHHHCRNQSPGGIRSVLNHHRMMIHWSFGSPASRTVIDC